MKKLTPMMEQYMKIKEQYKSSLVFYRLGDFYELFFEDAKIASEVLNIRLTARGHSEDKIPMCGVPHHSSDTYISKLVEAGYKVAVCEQVSDPSAKGIVEREVVRVISSGTVLEGRMLECDKNNYIATIYFDEKKLKTSISYCDITSGEFMGTCTNISLSNILDELSKFKPSEILVSENFPYISEIEQKFSLKVTELNIHRFNINDCSDRLKRHFAVHNLNGFGLQDKPEIIIALGALLSYLMTTQKNSLLHINTIKIITNNDSLIIDSSSRRSLELTESMRYGNKKGSLFAIIEKTKTPLGSRLLRKSIDNPLYNNKLITERLDAVEYFKNNILDTEELRELLGTVKDIERILGRLAFNQVNGQDLLNLASSLMYLPEIINLVNNEVPLLASIKENFDTLEDIYQRITDTINEDAPNKINDCNLIRRGFNKELDKLYSIKENGSTYILQYERKVAEETGIRNLKIKHNKVLGYFFEVTKVNLDFVPDYFINKQSLVGHSRYYTDELKRLEQEIFSSEEKIIEIEVAIFNALKQSLIEEINRIKVTASNIALIDMLQSFAYVSYKNNYCKPKLIQDGEIIIKDGRHPVVEALNNTPFTPNDTLLNYYDNNLLVITGPNMAGKSTYMRQVALIVIMAQIGCFVPASEFSFTPVDKIFTRVGASDDLASGQSTFMLEMNELANILNNATKNSLVILDEIGRGTSTYDGLSIAWSVLEYIVNDSNIGAKTLFATHYHELAELESQMNGVKNYHITIAEQGDDVVFLHKIAEGYVGQSYGIHVAKIAGVPDAVIKRANHILKLLEQQNESNSTLSSSQYEQDDFKLQYINEQKQNNTVNKLIDAVNNVDINCMTPLVAFEKLLELQNILKGD